MAKVHTRTLEIVLTTTFTGTFIKVTAVNYYRTDAELAANTPFALAATANEAGLALGTNQASPYDIFLGELVPPPSRIRLTATLAG